MIEGKNGNKEICITKERKEEKKRQLGEVFCINIWTEVADKGLKRRSHKEEKGGMNQDDIRGRTDKHERRRKKQ